jgi:carboxyl-terminal processing protease
LKTDEDLKKLLLNAEKMRKKRKETLISLNEAKRKAEKEAAKNEQKSEELPDDEEENENTPNEPNKKKPIEQFKNLKDLYLKNATQIITDLVQLSK